MKKHENYHPDRVDAHVIDIAKQPLPFATGSANYATLVFVMSALNPKDMMFALKEVRRVLASDGVLLLRDYAVGDLTMLRFKSGAKIGERFYKRGDGTRTYFFERDEVIKMLREAGFLVEDDDALYIKKIIENRKRDLKMKRIWLQCKVKCDPAYVPAAVTASESAATAPTDPAPESAHTTQTSAGAGPEIDRSSNDGAVDIDSQPCAKRAKME